MRAVGSGRIQTATSCAPQRMFGQTLSASVAHGGLIAGDHRHWLHRDCTCCGRQCRQL